MCERSCLVDRISQHSSPASDSYILHFFLKPHFPEVFGLCHVWWYPVTRQQSGSSPCTSPSPLPSGRMELSVEDPRQEPSFMPLARQLSVEPESRNAVWTSFCACPPHTHWKVIAHPEAPSNTVSTWWAGGEASAFYRYLVTPNSPEMVNIHEVKMWGTTFRFSTMPSLVPCLISALLSRSL